MLHPVTVASVDGAFDLFEPDAGSFFQWVRPSLERPSPREVVTGTAPRAELPGLWTAIDATYVVSQGYFHLASRAALVRGAHRRRFETPAVEREALHEGIRVYTHEDAKPVGSFVVFVRRGDAVLRTDELTNRKELDRALERLSVESPDDLLLGAELRFRVFWHIHM